MQTISLETARARYQDMHDMDNVSDDTMPVEILHTMTEAWVALRVSTPDISDDIPTDRFISFCASGLINMFDNHTVFANQESAEALAHKLNADPDDAWTYEAQPDIGGFAVMVFDEDGHLLGKL